MQRLGKSVRKRTQHRARILLPPQGSHADAREAHLKPAGAWCPRERVVSPRPRCVLNEPRRLSAPLGLRGGGGVGRGVAAPLPRGPKLCSFLPVGTRDGRLLVGVFEPVSQLWICWVRRTPTSRCWPVTPGGPGRAVQGRSCRAFLPLICVCLRRACCCLSNWKVFIKQIIRVH